MTIRIIIFIVINFAALGLGSLLMGQGASSEWYQQLNKAPWTPPGWAFGAAWFTIMLCYGIYMAQLWEMESKHQFLIGLFTMQWVLNVAWNPVFFRYHYSFGGLLIITALTVLVGYFIIQFGGKLKFWNLLIVPYFLWLIIATSLNAYIYFKN